MAMSEAPGITTTECAAYRTPLPPLPPLPLRELGGYHEYEVVAQGNVAYAHHSPQFGGVNAPSPGGTAHAGDDISPGRTAVVGDNASGVYEDTEGAYELLPGEAQS